MAAGTGSSGRLPDVKYLEEHVKYLKIKCIFLERISFSKNFKIELRQERLHKGQIKLGTKNEFLLFSFFGFELVFRMAGSVYDIRQNSKHFYDQVR